MARTRSLMPAGTTGKSTQKSGKGVEVMVGAAPASLGADSTGALSVFSRLTVGWKAVGAVVEPGKATADPLGSRGAAEHADPIHAKTNRQTNLFFIVFPASFSATSCVR
jgi:hypothetical protein